MSKVNTPAADNTISPDTNHQSDPDPMQDILPCLFQALIAALPVFIQSFFTCIGGGGPGSTDYKPGDRHRCA